MSPSRRTLLRSCGVGLTAAVGGCLSADEGSPTTAADEPPEVREVSEVDRGVPSALTGESAGDRFLELAVGSREGVSNPDNNKPHVAEVWNETEDALTVGLTLTTDGATILDESYDFDAGTTLAIDLREPRTYELSVRTDDRKEVTTVERERFDCNDSATDVVIRDEIESGWITTELACSTTDGDA